MSRGCRTDPSDVHIACKLLLLAEQAGKLIRPLGVLRAREQLVRTRFGLLLQPAG